METWKGYWEEQKMTDPFKDQVQMKGYEENRAS